MENRSQFIIYQTANGQTKLDVRFQNETVWLTQALMAQLFATTPENILMHLKNIYQEGELEQNSTTKDFLVVRQEGIRQVKRNLKHYNLDAIISVGYRVQSLSATQFRQWATQQLNEYIVKGFVLDDERLKNPDLPFDYFEELTRRIQDIRTSEKRFYQKITDIYATSVDYDPTQEISIQFFKTVQNKIHWAITGQTAAEIVYQRADKQQENMGLTNWRGCELGRNIRKADVTVAKNYLQQDELQALNNLTEQYLVFAEGQAMRRIPMNMQDWIKKLDGFLMLNDRALLTHAGKISHNMTKESAELEFSDFKVDQVRKMANQADKDDIKILDELIKPNKF